MKTSQATVLLAAVLIVGQPARVAYAQTSQSELAQQILSDDPEQHRKALNDIRAIGLQNASGDVRAAMFAALRREADIHTQRYHADPRGEALTDLRDPEFVATLAAAVTELHDPQAIPALSAALFAGPLVSLALADFGERAAPSVVQPVMAPDAWYDTVDGGLISLRFILERRSEHPLSPATMAQIRDATTQHLIGKQYFTTLWRAIDVAAVLGDASLRSILELLASDPNEVFARGVEDPDLIKLTEQRAADRLAGLPPLPRLRDVMSAQP
jgi:hypothetical protein